MIYKIGFGIIAIAAAAFGSAWLFNHVNPWLSLLITASAIVIAIGFIVSVIKQSIKNKEK